MTNIYNYSKFGAVIDDSLTTAFAGQGPPGVGFKLTPEGNYDIDGKDIENIANISVTGCLQNLDGTSVQVCDDLDMTNHNIINLNTLQDGLNELDINDTGNFVFSTNSSPRLTVEQTKVTNNTDLFETSILRGVDPVAPLRMEHLLNNVQINSQVGSVAIRTAGIDRVVVNDTSTNVINELKVNQINRRTDVNMTVEGIKFSSNKIEFPNGFTIDDEISTAHTTTLKFDDKDVITYNKTTDRYTIACGGSTPNNPDVVIDKTDGLQVRNGIDIMDDMPLGNLELGRNNALNIDVIGVLRTNIIKERTPNNGVSFQDSLIKIDNATANCVQERLIKTNIDNFPLIEMTAFNHDNCYLLFDSFYDCPSSLWKSSDIGSNFTISKRLDTLAFRHNAGTAQNSAFTWTDNASIDNIGRWRFETDMFVNVIKERDNAGVGVNIENVVLLDGNLTCQDLTVNGTHNITIPSSVFQAKMETPLDNSTNGWDFNYVVDYDPDANGAISLSVARLSTFLFNFNGWDAITTLANYAQTFNNDTATYTWGGSTDGRVTINTTGNYKIEASCNFRKETGALNKTFQLVILKINTVVSIGTMVRTDDNLFHKQLQISDVINVTSGENISLGIIQGNLAGTNAVVDYSVGNIQFSVIKV